MRIFLFIAVLAASMSCQSQKNTAADLAENAAATQDTLIVIVEKPVQSKDSLIIAFEKTPCFGRCPVYKIKVYQSGFALYEGINFAEKMGMYSAVLTESQIENIYDSAIEIGYFDLDAEYNNPLITDLPSTISRINYDGRDHRILARNNVPERLKIFHDNLSITLLEKNWKPYNYH